MAKFKNDKGLTLIELLITISVLAVVSAIALPVINNVVAASNSNAYNQTVADANDFVNKYSKSGVVAYDGLTKTFSGYVDTDGDNVIDATEKIDTLTLDSKYSATATGSATVGGSYTAGGVTAVTITDATAPVAGYVFDTTGYAFSGSAGMSSTWSAATPVLFTNPGSSIYHYDTVANAAGAAAPWWTEFLADNTASLYGGAMFYRNLSAEPTTGSGAQILPLQ